MKVLKVLGVIALFGVVIYLALGLKKRIVQQTCNTLGNYEAVSGEDIMGSDDEKAWYCCPEKKERNVTNCSYYGD